MKKTNINISEDLKFPVLYLNDLEEIEKIYYSTKRQHSFNISIGDYSYDNVKDIEADGSAVHNCQIKFSFPYVSIDLRATGPTIFYSHEADTFDYGLIHQVRNVLLKRERKFLYFIFRLRMIFMMSILCTVLVRSESNSKLFDLSFLAIFLTYMLFALLYNFKWGATVVLDRDRNLKGFFKRNKDQLLTSIISGTIGAVIGVTLKALYDRLH